MRDRNRVVLLRPPAAVPLKLGIHACAVTATQDDGAVSIPGGAALVGTRTPGILDDGETSMRKARVAPFRIGATTVRNAEFRAFVDATQYVSEAERFGWSFVFWAQVPQSVKPTSGVVGAEWWRQVEGANWRDINGPGTEAAACHPNHPVVHISWNDARAYCDWIGGALPSEAEWEHAARGGLGDVKFPWGDDEPHDDAFFPAKSGRGNSLTTTGLWMATRRPRRSAPSRPMVMACSTGLEVSGNDLKMRSGSDL